MTKISHPPRPPNVPRGPQRPVERRRARGQGVQGGAPSRIDELDEDELGIDEEKEIGASDHHGERPSDTHDQALRMLEEHRKRGNADAGHSQAEAREQREQRESISSQHATAEVQRQSLSSRGIFGGRTQSSESISKVDTRAQGTAKVVAPSEGSAPSGVTATTVGASTSARPVTSSGPVTGSSPVTSGPASASTGAHAPVPTASAKPLSAHGLLATGKKVGTFLRELSLASLTDSDTHTRLRAAVDEAQRLLSGKDGIGRVALGEDKNANPVVLVIARRGVSLQQLLATVPEAVQGVATRISIGFDVLPLRRSGGAGPSSQGGLPR
ncbi:hypothetical protein LY474_13045 [Myxococcus stipitatus]|uniref:hypothetical protein n=1 Tax=Myxococcus stipitatus TaxID=83455 RepID=UPI001F23EB10|nr:hypothetical protein [Myxococcus stipitatus]MCE9668744.1 hypothetical protein [Myxococcus stipitatus]